MVVITEEGAFFTQGIPDHYLKDDDFEKIIKDKDLAKQIYHKIGRCCIERLGKQDVNGIYYEEEHLKLKINDQKAGDLGFYAKYK